MQLTLEQKRNLAALNTLRGFRVLVDIVVKSNWDDALTKLKLAHGQEAVLDAAHRFRAWDEVIKVLESAPRAAEEELKKEGDQIYG